MVDATATALRCLAAGASAGPDFVFDARSKARPSRRSRSRRHAAATGFAGILGPGLFAAAVLAMILAMFVGMSASFGDLPWPWAALANAALLAQFPLAHSVLLTGPGARLLARLGPAPHGACLASTT